MVEIGSTVIGAPAGAPAVSAAKIANPALLGSTAAWWVGVGVTVAPPVAVAVYFDEPMMSVVAATPASLSPGVYQATATPFASPACAYAERCMNCAPNLAASTAVVESATTVETARLPA